MSTELKREYLAILRNRYKISTKSEKSNILSGFCADFGYSRKYAIRILNSTVDTPKKKPGRKAKYGAATVFHLKKLWNAMGRVNSKSLVAALPAWLPHYAHPLWSEEVKKHLLEISPATVDRLLQPYRKLRGICSTRPSNLLKNEIPIALLDGEIKKPGYVEADTVAHCGTSLCGVFANTLTMTDLFSGWTENRATFSKSAEEIRKHIQEIELFLPFPINTFASDNGSEFLNYSVLDHFRCREKKVKVVRSRPYKKNDNAHVEQKNFTHVRELFGYHRVEDQEMVKRMNHIYFRLWNPYKNYFIPCTKLIEKKRVGSKIKKTYDNPRTPYQRLLECADITDVMKIRLQQKFESLNPFELKFNLSRQLLEFKTILKQRMEIYEAA